MGPECAAETERTPHHFDTAVRLRHRPFETDEEPAVQCGVRLAPPSQESTAFPRRLENVKGLKDGISQFALRKVGSLFATLRCIRSTASQRGPNQTRNPSDSCRTR